MCQLIEMIFREWPLRIILDKNKHSLTTSHFDFWLMIMSLVGLQILNFWWLRTYTRSNLGVNKIIISKIVWLRSKLIFHYYRQILKAVIRLRKYYTMSWGCWKHVFGIPGVRPMFLKAELYKESKNGFKTINSRYPVQFFFKKLFSAKKKIPKKVGGIVNFWIFLSI